MKSENKPKMSEKTTVNNPMLFRSDHNILNKIAKIMEIFNGMKSLKVKWHILALRN